MSGTLYIVATPIGNLGDITRRAADVLASADLIACEDTRTSSVLLRHLGINKPMLSFHQHNEHNKVGELIRRIQDGSNVALISDAGTPGISDPGFLAVREAHKSGVRVVALPGASAALTALVASGLPSERFVFEGFLPPKKGRRTRLQLIAAEDRTVVIFESPHRIARLVGELRELCDDERIIAITRELTKKFEEVIRGGIGAVHEELNQRGSLKGEIVVIVSGINYTE